MSIIGSLQVNNQEKKQTIWKFRFSPKQWTLEAQMSYYIKQNISHLEESLLK